MRYIPTVCTSEASRAGLSQAKSPRGLRPRGLHAPPPRALARSLSSRSLKGAWKDSASIPASLWFAW
ncbi:hypothetical protein TthTF19_24180 (plasmid) [Thermus thermophilus]